MVDETPKIVACNTDYTVYLDIYFKLDTAEVVSSSRHLKVLDMRVEHK